MGGRAGKRKIGRNPTAQAMLRILGFKGKITKAHIFSSRFV